MCEDSLHEVGCLFPDKCCMPGEHFMSECHTAEMMELLTEEQAPPAPERTPGQSAIEAVAEAWASIDGRLEQFRAEREMAPDDPRRQKSGRYDGYMVEAEELLKRIRARAYILVPAGELPPSPEPTP